MIQVHVHCIVDSAHSRQVLIMLFCVVIHRCKRYILAQRRVCTQPSAGFWVQIPCTLAKVGYRMLSILCLGVLLSQGVFYSLVTLDLTFHIS